MTNERACATEEAHPEPAKLRAESMYSNANPINAGDLILRIKALARLGACATDTTLIVDLMDTGFLGLFETIAELADEIFAELDELYHQAASGPYAR